MREVEGARVVWVNTGPGGASGRINKRSGGGIALRAVGAAQTHEATKRQSRKPKKSAATRADADGDGSGEQEADGVGVGCRDGVEGKFQVGGLGTGTWTLRGCGRLVSLHQR